jgi:hypothetical protein
MHRKDHVHQPVSVVLLRFGELRLDGRVLNRPSAASLLDIIIMDIIYP